MSGTFPFVDMKAKPPVVRQQLLQQESVYVPVCVYVLYLTNWAITTPNNPFSHSFILSIDLFQIERLRSRKNQTVNINCCNRSRFMFLCVFG